MAGNSLLSLALGAGLFSAALAATADSPTNTVPPAAAKPADDTPQSPGILPGNGLTQHDFFYAGEAKDERMFIVRGGKITWSYTHPGKGEISDATLLSNSNVLFAHQFGVTEINSNKEVVWNYDAPTNCEIHTAQAIGNDHVWFIQNGNPAILAVVNKSTGRIETRFNLPVANTNSVHGQFRHARLTPAGTLLVAHMDSWKVCEYNLQGKELWSLPAPGVWSADPLANGNILLTGNVALKNNQGPKYVREVTRKGDTVWEWTTADAPDYKFTALQLAVRLPGGNTIINNWFNQWSSKLNYADLPVQAIEVTPDKKVVWALRSWTEPAALGPATTIQILDDPSVPENVSFGDIK